MSTSSLSSRLAALRNLDLLPVKHRRDRALHAAEMRAFRAKRKAERERLLALASSVRTFVGEISL